MLNEPIWRPDALYLPFQQEVTPGRWRWETAPHEPQGASTEPGPMCRALMPTGKPTGPSFTLEVPSPEIDVFEKFALLDFSESSILYFVDHYGPLRGEAVEGHKATDGNYYFSEHLFYWEIQHHKARRARDLHRAVYNAESGELGDLERLVKKDAKDKKGLLPKDWQTRRQPKGREASLVNYARRALRDAVNNGLQASHTDALAAPSGAPMLSVFLVDNPGGQYPVALAIQPRGLIGAIWLQAAQRLAGTETGIYCSECGKWKAVRRTKGKGRAITCGRAGCQQKLTRRRNSEKAEAKARSRKPRQKPHAPRKATKRRRG